MQALDVPDDPLTEEWSWRQLSPTSQDEDLSAGDIDSDGDLDLLLGTKWLSNDSQQATPSTPSGPWTVHDLFLGDGYPDRNQLVDINGNGRLDAVIGYEPISSTLADLAWYEQPSTTTDLWTEHVIANLTGPMSLDIADMDGDADPDIVVGEHDLENDGINARIMVYENPGNSTDSWVEHLIYIGDEHHDGAQLVDIDNDGDLDVISIGWGHNRVLIYENLSCSSTNIQTTPTSTPIPASTPTEAEINTPTPTPDQCAIDPNNIVPNPGFEEGTSNWSSFGVSSFTTTSTNLCGQAAHLAFDSISSNMQLYQTDIPLQPNTDYELSFSAYSSSGNDLNVNLHRHTDPYTNYGIDNYVVNLTSSWQNFTIPFTTPGDTTTPRFRFWFVDYAAAGDVYWIDNVLITPAGGTPSPTPTNSPTPTPIPSDTPTHTPSPTNTTMPTPEDTATPVPTATDTPTATHTPTPEDTETPVPTATDTPTATHTPTPEDTETPVPTATDTPTATHTPTPENTETPVPTATGTPTITLTPTPTSTNTPIPDDTEPPMPTATKQPIPPDPADQCAIDPNNIVSNPGFDGLSNWLTYGVSSFTTASTNECGRAARLVFNNISSDMRLYQIGIPLQPNTDYELFFSAYSSSGHDLNVDLHRHTYPYTSYGVTNYVANLTPSWKHFTIPFTTPSDTAMPRLRFWFVGYAAADDVYWIDNVYIVPVNANNSSVTAATASLPNMPSEIQAELFGDKFTSSADDSP